MLKLLQAKVAADTALKMARAPEVLLQIVRTAARRRWRAAVDFPRRDGTSGPFARIDIKITNACNLRCEMCGQWGEAGWHLSQPFPFLSETLPLTTYQRLIDDVAPSKPWISVWGGEPFLYRPLLPLLSYIKQKGLTVTVNTNGTFLAGNSRELVEMGLDFLIVSIDGGRDTHDRVRGIAGAFDKTFFGIREIQEHKRRRGTPKPFVVIGGTINQQNAGCFDEVFTTAQELEADAVTACYGWFQTEDSCRRHEAVMFEKAGILPISQRGWLWKYDEIDTSALTASVRRIQSNNWPFSYVFIPQLDIGDIPRYYREHSCTFGYTQCVVPWTVVQILPNGDVATCGDYPDYVVGNIRENSILELWNNDRYRKFRGLLQEGLLPVCSRCCGLLAD